MRKKTKDDWIRDDNNENCQCYNNANNRCEVLKDDMTTVESRLTATRLKRPPRQCDQIFMS